MKKRVVINDLIELADWSREFASQLHGGEVIALCGDLGAGKTTAAGMIINTLLDKKQSITSPTFNLVHTYPWRIGRSIWHFDLYRLKYLEEVYELGIEEALSQEGITIIEWPEVIMSILPITTTIIYIKSNSDNSCRVMDIVHNKGLYYEG